MWRSTSANWKWLELLSVLLFNRVSSELFQGTVCHWRHGTKLDLPTGERPSHAISCFSELLSKQSSISVSLGHWTSPQKHHQSISLSWYTIRSCFSFALAFSTNIHLIYLCHDTNGLSNCNMRSITNPAPVQLSLSHSAHSNRWKRKQTNFPLQTFHHPSACKWNLI